MATKLTNAAVLKQSRPGIRWDGATTGLGIKTLQSGAKVWVLQLRWPRQKAQSTRNIGHYPAMSLADARTRAEKFYALAKEGTDPFALERAERRREEYRRQNTFAAFAERYIEGRTNRRAEQDAAEIRRMLMPTLGDMPLHDIKPRDVRQLIEKLVRRAPYDARNAWTHLVGLFKSAVHEEFIEVSPCASLDKRLLFRGAKIEPRQRVLNDDEVRALWRATSKLGYPSGPIIRLLVLTGCRVGEIVGARWSELHPELRRIIREAGRAGNAIDWATVPDAHKLLVIPRSRFKSDAEHRVQLSNDACAVIAGVPRMAGSDFLFTARGDAPTWLGAKIKQRVDCRMLRTLRALARVRGDDPAQVRLERWKWHDLRRVVRSNLSALRVDDHVAEMVLGHGRTGLQRIYDGHRYEQEIREALELWATRLRAIVEPTSPAPYDADNVVQLKASA